MGKMKRFLATLLVATMLIGNNGISYAAEIPGGTDEVAQETEVVEAEAESEAETDVAAESDQEEAQDASVENSASDSEQEETEAVEEDAQEVKEEAVEEPASEDEQTTEAAKDESEEEPASQSDGQDADDAAEEGRTEVSDTAETVEPAAPEEEETFEAGELVYPGEDYGKDYTVSLSYDADAKIPAGAELRVREIEKDTDEYNSYLESTQSAVEKGVADARFFDITIVAKKDGEEVEVQPQAQVRVNISYKEAIEVAAEDNGEIQAIHFDEEKEEPDVLDVETDDNEEVSEVEFKAESFSVYGVVYTVDFTYDGYTFSIPGEGSILLSALAEQLNLAEKNFALENVKDVTFSNNELLKIEKQDGGDWLLTSLKAFTSEETLTILMADGSKFLIVVTDAQANGRLTFYKTDGTTVDTSASVSSNYYIAAGNNNNISGVAKVQPQNGVANLSFGDADLSGCSFTLVQYTGSGDLTPAYASSNWWYDPNGALTKPSDFGLYTFNTSGGVNDLKAVKKDGYYVNLAFYDHDQQNPVIPGVTEGAKAIDQHAFVRVLLRDKDDNIVGYGIAPIPTNGSVNSIVIDRFTRLTGGNMSYAEAKAEGYSVPSGGANVRVGYKADANLPSYADFDDTSSTFTADRICRQKGC